MIEHPTKSNFKNPKNGCSIQIHAQCQKSKNIEFLDFCWIFIGFLDWIGFFSSKIQHFLIADIEPGLNIHFFGF
jgi:hypothetical protein